MHGWLGETTEGSWLPEKCLILFSIFFVHNFKIKLIF